MTRARAIAILAGLLSLYLALVLHSARGMSATYDEPLHVGGAYAIRDRADFRVNPEDPAGFGRWVGLALSRGDLAADYGAPDWVEMAGFLPAHWNWCTQALFPRPGTGAPVDHESVMWRARGMMIAVAVMLFAATAGLAWALGSAKRGWAAVIATAPFALDPTLIAHGGIVKNDLACALGFALAAIAVVRLARQVTLGSAALLAAAIAWGCVMKFSGLLLFPLVGAALLPRALLGGDWPIGPALARSTPRRVGVVLGLELACLLVMGVATWGVYGFRYSIGEGIPTDGELPELSLVQRTVAWRELHREPSEAEARATPLPNSVAVIAWADDHKLMPRAWSKGFLYTWATAHRRVSYLLGERSETGWWYYFPLGALFKWPLGTVGLVVLGAGLGLRRVWVAAKNRNTEDTESTEAQRRDWGSLAVLVMTGGYLAIAMTGDLNIGVRHLIPMVPLVYALVGSAVARGMVGGAHAASEGPQIADPAEARRLGSRPGGMLVAGLLAMIAIETLSSADRCIAFFNLPSRLFGPERLLGDSNLDWGQDVKKLVAWQRAHPDVPLYLRINGSAVPEAYGLRYQPLLGSAPSWGTPIREPPGGSVVAISAAWLQEIPLLPDSKGLMAPWRNAKPRDVLGGSVFLFDVPPHEERDRAWDVRWRS